jgi:hypothetical protein
MMDNYILVDGKPVIEPDIQKWGQWLKTADRILKQDTIGNVQISTVFLGMNYNFGYGPPVLWETMIFGGVHDRYQGRYTSREGALEGHAMAIMVVEGLNSTYPEQGDDDV